MDAKQLRIHVQMLEAALDHAALVAELGREAAEGEPAAEHFDAVRKMVRDFRHTHPAIANLWFLSLGMDATAAQQVAAGSVEGRRAELHNLLREPLPPEKQVQQTGLDMLRQRRESIESAEMRHPNPPADPGAAFMKREPPRGLMSVLDMSPEQVARAEWRGVGETVKQAQDRLQADGSRQTWLDWAVEVCRERGKEPE